MPLTDQSISTGRLWAGRALSAVAALMWGGLWLRDGRLRATLPLSAF